MIGILYLQLFHIYFRIYSTFSEATSIFENMQYKRLDYADFYFLIVKSSILKKSLLTKTDRKNFLCNSSELTIDERCDTMNKITAKGELS